MLGAAPVGAPLLGLGLGVGLWALAGAGCSGLELDPPAEVIHARFDPDAKVIPMPTDVLRDAVSGHLDVPLDGELTEAEREFYRFLNGLDGWSSAMQATIELDGAIDPSTVTADSLQVWRWRETPERVDGVTVTVAADELSISIDAPRTGWLRGERYAIVLRGGTGGIEGKRGEKVECDAAFYFLRQTERLDTPAHERAFPGDTAAERQENARKLEEIRVDLAPIFDFVGDRGLDRSEIAALWAFTVTERVELAMDKPSQRMPLPMNLLLDPATGRIDLPPAAWDSPTVLEAKERLRLYDGFGTSANLMFGFTGPIDPASLDRDSIELWKVEGPDGPALERVPAAVALLDDGVNVEVTPDAQPLPERTRYAVVVRDTVRASDGTPILMMPAGHFVRAAAPVAIDGASEVDAVADEDALRLERVRGEVVPFLEARAARQGSADPDAGVLAAWTFTTMSITAPMASWLRQPEELGVPVEPADIVHQSPFEALGDFLLAIGSLGSVGDVYHGTIASPVFLDRETRAFRADGGHEVQPIAFTMTAPRNLQAGQKVPIVVFAHAIMTERRMVLAIGDALAREGYAAIAIDLPMHGSRAYCWSEGPLTVPNPSTGQLTPIADPCSDGSVCQVDGRCLDSAGQARPLRLWPVISMPMSSGAAFIELEQIANTRDHFQQSLIDLTALVRSLRQGHWETVLGAPIDPDRIYFAGQSLGGIIGATFVAVAPDVRDAVLNVPGADVVDLFNESPFFKGQVDAFFVREGVDPTSFDGRRFLNVARWFLDSTDPASFASGLRTRPDGSSRRVMVQMATLDFIIPNNATEKLVALSQVPRRDYFAEHAFLVIPVEPEYGRGGNELASFLAGGWNP
jgi:hypothetical protein